MPVIGWYMTVALMTHLALLVTGRLLRSAHLVYLSVLFGIIFLLCLVVGIVADLT